MLPFLARTTRFVQGLREIDKLADKQVEPPIVVIIEPHCARRPSRSRNPGSLRDISESAIAIVVIQNASAILRNVQVGKAIAIVVANRYTLAEPTACDSGFLRDIGKRAIAVIAI